MIRAVDVRAELAGLPALRERDVNTPADEVEAAFAALAPFRDGGVFAGRFSGETPWERHRKGDERVQVLDGARHLAYTPAGALRPVSASAQSCIVAAQARNTPKLWPSQLRDLDTAESGATRGMRTITRWGRPGPGQEACDGAGAISSVHADPGPRS